jgi:endonuclease/exonuclease/phosphatase family metal-dependent hydrolase
VKVFIFIFTIFLFPLSYADELRVMSWNIYMLPSPIKESLQKTRIRIIPGKLKEQDFDLLFMQEAFMKSLRTSVKRTLKETHPHTYYLHSPSFPYPVFGSGLFVVSRFPVKIIDHIYYHSCTSADCFAAKGSALVEITLPGGEKVQVANTHLQAVESAGAIRMKQLGQIHSMLVRNSRPDVPQFLIGDLNIDFHDPEFMMGLNLLGMDYTRLRGPILWTSGRENPCFKTGHKTSWVDHMWFSNYHQISASSMRVHDFSFESEGRVCPLSDHHAIEASFVF